MTKCYQKHNSLVQRATHEIVGIARSPGCDTDDAQIILRNILIGVAFSLSSTQQLEFIDNAANAAKRELARHELGSMKAAGRA